MLLIAASAPAFIGCSSGNKESAAVEDTVTAAEAMKHEHEQDITATEAGKPEFTVDQIFQEQIGGLFKSYVDVKEAFVSSDAGKVKDEAAEMSKELKKVDMKLLTGAAHNDWMTYLKEMETALSGIGSASGIEAQREQFPALTNGMYRAIKAFGLGGATTAYYEFCPMAFNDKGAYWLSDNEKIRNPYFGDKMLTCGSVEEKLQ